MQAWICFACYSFINKTEKKKTYVAVIEDNHAPRLLADGR